MVDDELISEIHNAIAKFPEVSPFSDSQATALLDALAKRNVSDPAQTWWWANLKVDHETIPYGDRDGLEEVAQIVAPQANALLVVTDDQPRPWPVFFGPSFTLLAVLREVRFCEYFLADPDFKWLIFDTHHNALVVVGSLPLCRR